MSLIHFKEFEADVKRINPQYKETRSCLRPLIEYLRKEQQKAKPLSMELAEKILNIRNDARFDKYKPAVSRLCSVWGQPQKSYPAGDHLQKVPMRRICFRGDFRGPDEIFAKGFKSWKMGAQIRYRDYKVKEAINKKVHPAMEPLLGMTKVGDIDPETAVCVTTDMDVASIFPIPEKKFLNEYIWIYCVFVESGAPTSTRQAMDAVQALQDLKTKPPANANDTKTRIGKILYCLHGKEMATKQIKPEHVLAAFKIKRRWNALTVTKNPMQKDPSQQNMYDVDLTKGGKYWTVRACTNNQAKLPESFASAFDEFFKSVEAKIWSSDSTMRQIPTYSDGFKKSLKV